LTNSSSDEGRTSDEEIDFAGGIVEGVSGRVGVAARRKAASRDDFRFARLTDYRIDGAIAFYILRNQADCLRRLNLR
jgi:hypothetical protein